MLERVFKTILMTLQLTVTIFPLQRPIPVHSNPFNHHSYAKITTATTTITTQTRIKPFIEYKLIILTNSLTKLSRLIGDLYRKVSKLRKKDKSALFPETSSP